MSKKWISYDKDYSKAYDMANELNISEITARVLINRNICTIEKAKEFLYPDINNFYEPNLMMDISKAVYRIKKAIEANERICIYGDYDVDGITSVSIAVLYLKELKANVCYYIPSRIDEGYGLNIESVEKLYYDNVKLLITVDCGIKSHDVINYMKTYNMDIIITDHHECDDFLPDAYCAINPHRKDCNYPFEGLAGVGVIFKLLCAVANEYGNIEKVYDLLDIVTLGTIADIVPLIDENRIITYYGIKRIQQSKNMGIKALLKVSGLEDRKIDAQSIAFGIAPRINAVGRISDPSVGVELFLCNDENTAYNLAKQLDDNNKMRQEIEKAIFDEAILQIENIFDFSKQGIIIVKGESWHVGVIGIVASRITEKYGLPSIVFTSENDKLRGSARSIEGFNIIQALYECNEILDRFGGHELAAGLTLAKENFENFMYKMNLLTKKLDSNVLIPKILVDYKLSSNNNTFNLVKELLLLEPFGCNNIRPLFVCRYLTVITKRVVGQNQKHLMLYVFDGKNYFNCIGYNLGFFDTILSLDKKIDIICSIEINYWNNKEQIQLSIKDIKIRE